ncbi:MAG: tyrosine-type recombinase/integrase [Pseudonocardiaceae bacterium]
MGIPGPLVRALREHRDTQAKERERAAELWQEGGWVFTQSNGRPIDPRADHDEWKALLKAAGVRDARLHEARHTAATMLQVSGVASDASFGKIRELLLPATSPFRLDHDRLVEASSHAS